MSSRKLRKSFLFLFFALIVVGAIYYFNLSNRHKAIVKTRSLHFFNIIDSDWQTSFSGNNFNLKSPSLLIDNIYKSMEGPKAFDYFALDDTKNKLLWLTGFNVSAKNTKQNNIISNDFICHTNFNFIEQEHYGRWGLLDRIGIQYPRLVSLSHGIEKTKFPEGYGFPLFSDENIFIITQSLNHNVKDSIFQIKHDISIDVDTSKHIKPLMPKTVMLLLPFDINTPYQITSTLAENSCIPVETKNHTYFNDSGHAFSGHWKIFNGEDTFTCNVTNQLALKDTLRLHKIVPHLHPFATEFILKDITSNTTIYNCQVKNHSDRIGLGATPDFTSKEGIYLYPEHEYTLTLKTKNTSNIEQDMMASMFMFFYDEEMDAKIKNYFNAN